MVFENSTESSLDVQNSLCSLEELEKLETGRNYKYYGSNRKGRFCITGHLIYIPARYVLTVMGFFGYFLISSFRLNLSLTIMAMVNATAVYGASNQSHTTFQSKEGEFDWSPKTQGLIMGANYYLLCVAFLIGGRLSELKGSKNVFGIGMFFYSIFTLLTPASARYHPYLLIAIRAATGFIQGLMFPSFAPLMRKWAPQKERSLMVSIVYCGLHFGSFVTVLVAGYLCDSDFLGGWPSVYYLSGLLGIVWYLLWLFLVYNEPSQHPRISDYELQYINSGQNGMMSTKQTTIPWKAILRSVPVWSTICVAFGVRWAQFHFYTVHPTYMATILHFPIKDNGILSSMPHLLIAVTVCGAGYISDRIRKMRCVTITTIHKSFIAIGMTGYLFCLIGVLFVGLHRVMNTALLVLAFGFIGIAFVGENVTPIDMSSHFSGTLMGLMGFFSTMSGFLIPAMVGFLTDKEQTMAQWRLVFYVSMLVVVATTVEFLVFGSAELQPWDSPTHRVAKEEANEELLQKAQQK